MSSNSELKVTGYQVRQSEKTDRRFKHMPVLEFVLNVMKEGQSTEVIFPLGVVGNTLFHNLTDKVEATVAFPHVNKKIQFDPTGQNLRFVDGQAGETYFLNLSGEGMLLLMNTLHLMLSQKVE